MQDEPTNPRPPSARTTDPQTSHDAAASVTGIRDSLRAVFECLRQIGPMTDEKLVNSYNELYLVEQWPRQSPSGIRSRRKELTREDPPLVRDIGRKERLESGRWSIVWGITL